MYTVKFSDNLYLKSLFTSRKRNKRTSPSYRFSFCYTCNAFRTSLSDVTHLIYLHMDMNLHYLTVIIRIYRYVCEAWYQMRKIQFSESLKFLIITCLK